MTNEELYRTVMEIRPSTSDCVVQAVGFLNQGRWNHAVILYVGGGDETTAPGQFEVWMKASQKIKFDQDGEPIEATPRLRRIIYPRVFNSTFFDLPV